MQINNGFLRCKETDIIYRGFHAFDEGVEEDGNATTCTEICLTVFKVSIESLYWEGSVGSQICFLKTGNRLNGITSFDGCLCSGFGDYLYSIE